MLWDLDTCKDIGNIDTSTNKNISNTASNIVQYVIRLSMVM